MSSRRKINKNKMSLAVFHSEFFVQLTVKISNYTILICLVTRAILGQAHTKSVFYFHDITIYQL